MTDLRDQFAMAAMPELIMLGRTETQVAELAYKHADAMITEREKDTVESKDKIKQMLVDAIKKEHPSLSTSTVCTAEHLIFQLTTGMQF